VLHQAEDPGNPHAAEAPALSWIELNASHWTARPATAAAMAAVQYWPDVPARLLWDLNVAEDDPAQEIAAYKKCCDAGGSVPCFCLAREFYTELVAADHPLAQTYYRKACNGGYHAFR